MGRPALVTPVSPPDPAGMGPAPGAQQIPAQRRAQRGAGAAAEDGPGRGAWAKALRATGQASGAAAQILQPLALFAAGLAAWELAVRALGLPPFILPAPSRIALELVRRHRLLAAHAAITFGEVLAGFALGAAAGVTLALLLDASPSLRRAAMPWLVASQAVPVFAVAPLLVLWLGYGWASKVAMASVITFFPVTVNVLDGLRPDPDALRLFVALGASRWQLLRMLKLPGALPGLLSGLKVAASVATIAAVIGEWVGAQAGLGYLMMQANAQLRVPLVFAALVWLAAMGLGLYGLVELVERRVSRRSTGPEPGTPARRVRPP